jgi:hypothetical protein
VVDVDLLDVDVVATLIESAHVLVNSTLIVIRPEMSAKMTDPLSSKVEITIRVGFTFKCTGTIRVATTSTSTVKSPRPRLGQRRGGWACAALY